MLSYILPGMAFFTQLDSLEVHPYLIFIHVPLICSFSLLCYVHGIDIKSIIYPLKEIQVFFSIIDTDAMNIYVQIFF